ncbi:MAG TPA: hypothetical protein VOA87_04060 [Thermoanaerobaculia bacterium]|nr:hypothetical protein [Thermoanaerobaculia bacterium]
MTRDYRDHDSDRDLEQAFAALRDREREGGPRFARVWAAAADRAASLSRRHRTLRLLPFAAAGAALFAALLAAWLIPQSPQRPAGAVPTISQWRPATDFLLRTPGRELLGEPPALGGGWLAPPSLSIPTTLKERRSS